MKNSTQKTAKKAGTKRTKAEIARETLRGLVEEAQEHTGTLAGLFALSDSELDEGAVTGSPPHRRERFNFAMGRVLAALECIEHQHCGGPGGGVGHG